MRAIRIACLVLLTAATTTRAEQDPLAAARELYRAASYEEALSALSVVDASAPEIARAVGQYRASCLVALGRTDEAEQVAEKLIEQQPLLRLDDAAPRIAALFHDVRKRTLPRLIRAEYKVAKAAIDNREYSRSRPHLLAARRMADEAERINATTDGLADLQVLIDGFLDLVDATAATTQRVPAGTSAPTSGAEATSTPQAQPPPTPDPVAPSKSLADVFGPEDEGVVPPAIISQSIPQLPSELARFITKRPVRGVVDVIVNQSGAAERPTVQQSLHPRYDALVIAASRNWRYTPAMKDGVPVKFRRTIMITLQ